LAPLGVRIENGNGHVECHAYAARPAAEAISQTILFSCSATNPEGSA